MVETKTKAKIKKDKDPEKEVDAVVDPKKYWEAVGRRKSSVARVRLFSARPWEEEVGHIEVNGKPYKKYFVHWLQQKIVEDSLVKLKSLNRFELTVMVSGGGINSQAEAIRHGIARTLVEFNADFRKKLKRAGYIKRDPREKERKKPGLRSARRAPQWAKR